MITSIALYDDTTSTYYTFVTDPKKQIEDYKKDDTIVEFYDTEHVMLTRFFQKYNQIKPTIISGWNSEFFDIPYLYNRVRILGETVFFNSLSPIGQVYYNEYKKKHHIGWC